MTIAERTAQQVIALPFIIMIFTITEMQKQQFHRFMN